MDVVKKIDQNMDEAEAWVAKGQTMIRELENLAEEENIKTKEAEERRSILMIKIRLLDVARLYSYAFLLALGVGVLSHIKAARVKCQKYKSR
jgi:hypothetical protein